MSQQQVQADEDLTAVAHIALVDLLRPVYTR